jgi:hypothetical protein
MKFMNRRKALKNLTLISGGAMLASSGLLQACNSGNTKRTELTESDVPLLDEIGEIIIPMTSSSPGAKEAKIGNYMLVIVNDCLTKEQQNIFIEGLNKMDEVCNQKYKNTFLEMNTSQKKEFIEGLQAEAEVLSNKAPIHYFNMLKALTINGYFTSEIGATKARRYEAIPTRYHGCISYKKGDHAWATS